MNERKKKSPLTFKSHHISKNNRSFLSHFHSCSHFPVFFTIDNSNANVKIFHAPHKHTLEKEKKTNPIGKMKTHSDVCWMRAFFAIEKRCLILRERTVNGCNVRVLLPECKAPHNSLQFSGTLSLSGFKSLYMLDSIHPVGEQIFSSIGAQMKSFFPL